VCGCRLFVVEVTLTGHAQQVVAERLVLGGGRNLAHPRRLHPSPSSRFSAAGSNDVVGQRGHDSTARRSGVHCSLAQPIDRRLLTLFTASATAADAATAADVVAAAAAAAAGSVSRHPCRRRHAA